MRERLNHRLLPARRKCTGHLRGEDHPMATMTEREVVEMRYLLVDRAGLNIQPTTREVAAIYDFSPGHVSSVACGKRWSHLGAVEPRRGVGQRRDRTSNVANFFDAKVVRKIKKAERILHARG